MKYLILLLFPLLSLAYRTGTEPDHGVLHLSVGNVQMAEGMLWIGIYDSQENFMVKEKAIVEGVEVKRTGTIAVNVDHVKFGDCAVAVFHDINANGNLDRNWLGIPIEPYAFSRKPASKWRLPRFLEVAFDFEPHRNELSVVLDRW